MGGKGRSRGGIVPPTILLLAALFVLPGPAAAGGAPGEGPAEARAPYYELSINAANATRSVDPSVFPYSATFTFQAKNTGDADTPSLNLVLSPWDAPVANWSYNFIPSMPMRLAPYDPAKTILLVVYPALDAEPRRYTFQIKDQAGISNAATINIDILQFGDVRVIAPPAQKAYPGEYLEFNFNIINAGNGADRFQVTSIDFELDPGIPYLKDANNWTPYLESGGNAVKTVVIALPFDTKYPGDPEGYRLTIRVVSEINASRHDSNSTFLMVERLYSLSLGIDPSSAAVLPGVQADFTVTVLNMGNWYDTVTVGVRAIFPSTNWTISLGNESLTLPAGIRATTTLRITPPYNALAGDTYIIEVSVRSSGPPGDEVGRTEYIRLTVLPVKGISVPQEHFPAPYQVGPGGAVQFPFNFTNTGNVPQTVVYNVSEAPAGWAASVEPGQALSVRPGASAGGMLKVVPSPDFTKSPAGAHTVKIRLLDTDGGLLRELSFEVQVAPVRGLELEPAGGAAREVNLFVSNRLSVLLSLWNTGNAPDEVNVAMAGDFASWGRFDAPFVTVGAGEARVLRLDLTVPETAVTVSIYPLTVRATSMGRPDLFVERLLFITVKDFDPAELRPRLRAYPQDPSLTLTGGDEYAFPVSVLCTGSAIGNVSLRITGAEGLGLRYEITELPRSLGAGENHTFLVVLRPDGSRTVAARGTLTIRAVGEGVSAEPINVAVSIQPAPRPVPVVSMEGLGIALGIFLALSGLALGWNEVVLVAFINLLLPLYVKLRREEVLDHYTRGKIHGYIIANPGEHYNSLKAQLRLKNGTLAYHLRVLEREGYVKTTRDGMFKRFYPMEALVPRRRSEFSGMQEIVLEHIRAAPGTNQNELARQMGVSSQVANYHIRSLVAAGMVRLERDGRETRCYLNDS
jgi:predicted transcriptional regulator/uncharacterized membrane protein